MAKAHSDQLVEQIEKTREDLAETIDALIDRTNPKNVAARQAAKVKGHFVAPDGSPRFENIVPVVGGVAALVAAIVVVRKLLK